MPQLHSQRMQAVDRHSAAGAVSAGAYTAGVMDFLIETLHNWEQHRGKPGVPTHRVVIPVIGGASAGGMTGILTAAAINQRFQPVRTHPAQRQPALLILSAP